MGIADEYKSRGVLAKVGVAAAAMGRAPPVSAVRGGEDVVGACVTLGVTSHATDTNTHSTKLGKADGYTR